MFAVFVRVFERFFACSFLNARVVFVVLYRRGTLLRRLERGKYVELKIRGVVGVTSLGFF